MPSPPDSRDLIFKAGPATFGAELPAWHDLQGQQGPVQNQGRLGSCGPHTVAGDLLMEQKQIGVPALKMPSRLFIYYATRFVMGTIEQDSGVTNRAMLKALNRHGWCDEELWPYRINQFTAKPSDESQAQAQTRLIQEYRAVPQVLSTMKACLVEGNAIVYGFMVYGSFTSAETERTGVVRMPGSNEPTIGGHDVLVIGFSDVDRPGVKAGNKWPAGTLKFKNSYGTEWGDGGYGYMPYAYATNPQLASDFWTITNPGIPGGNPPQPPAPPAADGWTITITGTGPKPTVKVA